MGLLSPALVGPPVAVDLLSPSPSTAIARGAASSTPMFTERPTCAVEKADTAGIGREIGTGGSNGICEGSPSCPPRACAKGGRPCSWALVGRAAAPTPCPAAPPGCSTTAPGKESSPLVAEEGRRRNGILAAAPPILLEEEQTSASWNVPPRDSARIFAGSKNRWRSTQPCPQGSWASWTSSCVAAAGFRCRRLRPRADHPTAVARTRLPARLVMPALVVPACHP